MRAIYYFTRTGTCEKTAKVIDVVAKYGKKKLIL
jgi:hypothetical protein